MNTARMLGAVIAAAAATSASAGTIYGVSTYAPFAPAGLYAIDTGTGAATLIGSTGVDRINGIAWNPGNNTMYAYSFDGELYTLNLTTGAATFVADQPVIVPEGDIAIAPTGAFHITDANELSILNGVTAAITPIGLMGTAADDVSGLIFGGNGSLYGYAKNGAASDTLVSLNPGTGAATTIGNLGFNANLNVGGLTFGADGVMYLTDGATLFSVNPNTGASTFIGSHGTSQFSGLAVPAPGVGALAGLVMLGAARRRR
ncbi:MAG: hypothetical protein ACKVZJ_15930 [Phycisphaerales bacterium]